MATETLTHRQNFEQASFEEKLNWLVTMLAPFVFGVTLEEIEVCLMRKQAVCDGRLDAEQLAAMNDRILLRLFDRAAEILNTYGCVKLVEWRDGRPFVPERTPPD